MESHQLPAPDRRRSLLPRVPRQMLAVGSARLHACRHRIRLPAPSKDLDGLIHVLPISIRPPTCRRWTMICTGFDLPHTESRLLHASRCSSALLASLSLLPHHWGVPPPDLGSSSPDRLEARSPTPVGLALATEASATGHAVTAAEGLHREVLMRREMGRNRGRKGEGEGVASTREGEGDLCSALLCSVRRSRGGKVKREGCLL